MKEVIEGLNRNPIVAAIEHEEQLKVCIDAPVEVVFLLRNDIFNSRMHIELLKAKGKLVLVHSDFIEGLANDRRAVEYIQRYLKPDGIIGTKSNVIRYGKELGLFTIQRFFMIDSAAFKSAVKTIYQNQPDAVEIMPGIIPTVIESLAKETSKPIIAGGLIQKKEDIISALTAGAVGVSTGKVHLWQL